MSYEGLSLTHTTENFKHKASTIHTDLMTGVMDEEENLLEKLNLKAEKAGSNDENLDLVVLYDYEPNSDDELKLKKGDRLKLISKDVDISGDEGWWVGQSGDKFGLFPCTFVISKEMLEKQNKFSMACPQHIDTSELNIYEVVGVGGFGRVYRGQWQGDEVAVKMVGCHDWLSLEREARMFCLLEHENIIALKGICFDNTFSCMVMEFAKGGPINKVISEYQLSVELIIDCALQIARAMTYLHEEAPIHILHRDLKSLNILLLHPFDPNSTIPTMLKLTDFGLSRQTDMSSSNSVARVSGAVGTYAWMAPEVIKFSIFSKKSDVWSFGVVLWELMTGEIPYKDVEAVAIAYQVANHKLTLPIPTSCPAIFSQLLKSCWEVDMELRPSFPELLRTLEEAQLQPFETDRSSFHDMQSKWKPEIEAIFTELRTKDQELRVREDELVKGLQQQKQLEAMLLMKEKELWQREYQLFERELQMSLHNLSLTSPHKPQARRGKFRTSRLKFASNDNSNLSSPTAKDISEPQNFCHNFSVQHLSSVSPSLTISPESVPPTFFYSPFIGPSLFTSANNYSQSALNAYPNGAKGRTWGPSVGGRDIDGNLRRSSKGFLNLEGSSLNHNPLLNKQHISNGDHGGELRNSKKSGKNFLKPVFSLLKSVFPGNYNDKNNKISNMHSNKNNNHGCHNNNNNNRHDNNHHDDLLDDLHLTPNMSNQSVQEFNHLNTPVDNNNNNKSVANKNSKNNIGNNNYFNIKSNNYNYDSHLNNNNITQNYDQHNMQNKNQNNIQNSKNEDEDILRRKSGNQMAYTYHGRQNKLKVYAEADGERFIKKITVSKSGKFKKKKSCEDRIDGENYERLKSEVNGMNYIKNGNEFLRYDKLEGNKNHNNNLVYDVVNKNNKPTNLPKRPSEINLFSIPRPKLQQRQLSLSNLLTLRTNKTPSPKI